VRYPNPAWSTKEDRKAIGCTNGQDNISRSGHGPVSHRHRMDHPTRLLDHSHCALMNLVKDRDPPHTALEANAREHLRPISTE
jgi:hypothetical protein